MRNVCFPVSNKGFASIYAIGFLGIVTIFTLLLLTQTITFMNTQTMKRNLHYAQLFSIYHVKAMLKNGIDSNADKLKSEDIEETEQKGFPIESETLMYGQHTVQFTYQEQDVLIQIDSLMFTLQCDLTKKEILELAYLSTN